MQGKAIMGHGQQVVVSLALLVGSYSFSLHFRAAGRERGSGMHCVS
jgi:hypothetical protein